MLTRLEEITRASAAADGAEPLDEGAWRRLTHHAGELDVRLDDDGFSIVDGELLHLVVAPDRRGDGIGGRLLGAALFNHPEVRRAWSHGDHPSAAALARHTGFDRVRELWVMRRSITDRDVPPAVDADLEIRPYRPGDEAELLRVNGAAFAQHPEQGSMDAEELGERMAEPWFDPHDVLVAVQDDHMYGFHWTKRHSGSFGEVYVMAIAPEAQGMGLGRALLDVGLRHLHSLGLTDVLLYVESDNAPAIGLYEKAGFTHAPADTHVMYERAADALSAPGS